MNRLLNNKTLNFIFKVLIYIAIAKSIALIIFVFLAKKGVEIGYSDKDIINFNSYNSASPFSRSSQSSSNAFGAQTTQISNLRLLAVYKENNGKNSFAVISDGSSSEVLKTGDIYKQYQIGDIKSNGVFLKESGNDFWVALAESAAASSNVQNAVKPSNNRFGSTIGRQQQIQLLQTNEAEYTNILKRSEIDELMANPDTVFKNIGFKEVMKDGKIDGFRVLSVNKNSPLAKLGIRAGDIIQSFNGIRLDNYSSVLEIYNNAKSYSRVKLEIMRNNEKKEFEYEIY
jgi:type II secretion system protein C